MKLNLNYISEEKEEQNIKEQEIISNYIQNHPETTYDGLIEEDMDLETVLALSNHRKNIINWYDFNPKASILEIGADLGQVTGALCEKLNRVVAVETSREKAKAIAKRHEDKRNLEIIAGDIKTLPLEEKFDYILLYQPNLLSYIRKNIKENTIILIATDNRFGITYFAGARHENDNVYDTILNNNSEFFSKNELEEEIRKEGYTKYKFYYPLPNYKMPNVIFSDEYIPHENTTKLMYNIMYAKGSVVTFDELKALKQITKSQQFPMFANSYLVEIAVNIQTELSKIKFVSYNNNRKEKYRLMTKMYQEQVVKEPVTAKAVEHMKTMELNTKKLEKMGFALIDQMQENRMISPYIEGETLDKIIISHILKGNLEGACELIERWYGEIKDKLLKDKKAKLNENIKLDCEICDGLTILKNGYIDLIFENTFYQDGKMVFFDQEWHFNGIPLEFILYRAIQNLYCYNVEIQNYIRKEDIFVRYGIENYLELFAKIEQYIQAEILDDKMQAFNGKSIEKLVDANHISLLKTQIEDYKANDKRQNEYIKALEEDNRKKQEYITVLEKKRKIRGKKL